MVVGLEVVLADGTRGPHRRRPGRRRRPRPQPAVHRVRGHARHRHPGVAAGPSRLRPPNAAPRTRSRRSPTAIEACRPILPPGATPAVLRLYDAVESARGRGGDGTRCMLLVLDEGDPRSSTPRWRSSPMLCDGRRPSSADDALVDALARAPQRHVSAAGADPQGLRRRHDGDRRAVVAGCRRCSSARVARCSPCPHTPSPQRATSRTATPTGRASTSRSPPRLRPTRSSRPTSRCGMPASAPCSPAAATCRTTTASGINRARFVAEALGAGLRRARRDEGRARPERHPQPRQARAAAPVRCRRRGHREPEVTGRWDGPATQGRRRRRPRVRGAVLDRPPLGRRPRRLERSPRLAEPRRRARVRARRRVRGVDPARRTAAEPRHRHRRRHVSRRPGGVRRHPPGPRQRGALVRVCCSTCSVMLGRRAASAACSAERLRSRGVRRRAASPAMHRDPRHRHRDDRRRAPPIVDGDLAIRALARPAVPAVDAVPGPRRVRRRRDGPPRARRRPARRSPTPASRSPPSGSPTSGPARSCGIAPPASRSRPALGWQDLRTVGECIMARPSTASRWHRTSRPRRSPGCSPTRPVPATATCASAPSTRGWRGCCPAATVHVTDPSNAAVTGLFDLDGRAGTSASSSSSACRRPMLPRSSTRAACVGDGDGAARRSRRSRPSSATSRRRWSARGA